MSLTYIKNRSGPSIDPCGTPAVMWYQSDEQPLITTRIFLLSR